MFERLEQKKYKQSCGPVEVLSFRSPALDGLAVGCQVQEFGRAWRIEMAGSVNKVILVGNLGADPEIRRMNSGDPVVNLRIATSESWRDRNTSERKERTEWHNVVIFNDNLAKVAEQYL